MSSRPRRGAAASAASAANGSAEVNRRKVESIGEAIDHIATPDEIGAMLIECNYDEHETTVRLIDNPFSQVVNKKEKKKKKEEERKKDGSKVIEVRRPAERSSGSGRGRSERGPGRSDRPADDRSVERGSRGARPAPPAPAQPPEEPPSTEPLPEWGDEQPSVAAPSPQRLLYSRAPGHNPVPTAPISQPNPIRPAGGPGGPIKSMADLFKAKPAPAPAQAPPSAAPLPAPQPQLQQQQNASFASSPEPAPAAAEPSWDGLQHSGPGPVGPVGSKMPASPQPIGAASSPLPMHTSKPTQDSQVPPPSTGSLGGVAVDPPPRQAYQDVHSAAPAPSAWGKPKPAPATAAPGPAPATAAPGPNLGTSLQSNLTNSGSVSSALPAADPLALGGAPSATSDAQLSDFQQDSKAMQAPSQASAGDLHLQFGQFSIGSNDFGSGFSSAFEPSHEPQGSEPASHSAVHSHQAVNPSAVDAFNAGGAGSNAYQTGSARDYSAFAQAPIQPSASKAPAAASAAGAAGPALQQQQAQHDAAASQQYYSNMPSSSAFQGSYGQSFGQHFQTPASQAYTSQQYQQYGADSSAGDSHSVAPVPSAAAAHKAYDNTSYGSYGQSTHQAPHQGHQASHQGMQSHQPASMHQASSAGHPGSALKAPATDYSGPGKYGNQSAAHAPSPVGALPASSGALGVSAASAAPPQPPVPQVPGFANPSGIPPSYAYAPYNFPYMAAASPYQYMQQGAAYQPYPPQNTAYAGQGAAFQQAGTSSYQGHGGAGGHQGTKYQPYNTQGYGASSNGYDEPVGGYGKPEKDSSSLYGGPRGQMHQGYQGRGQHAHAGHSSQHASHVQHGQHAQHSQQAQDTGYGYGQQTGYQSYQQQGYGGQGQYGGYGAQQYGIPYGQTPQGGPANGQAANTFKLQ